MRMNLLMYLLRSPCRNWTACSVILALLTGPIAAPVFGQQAAPKPATPMADPQTVPVKPATPMAEPKPAAPKPAAAPKTPAPPKDMGWPRIYSDGKATLAVHQPQVDDWKDFSLLQARSAIEITPEPGAKKLIAAAHWEAKTDTSVAERTVVARELTITRFMIPGADEAKSKQMQALATKLLPTNRDAVALDRVLAYLDTSKVVGRQVKISTEAPPILVSTTPAILVMIDGQPILGPISGSKLTFMVNTNWDLIKDGKDGDYFLLNEGHWLTAESLEGPWKPASKLPKELNSLPADENWADIKKALPLSKENKKKPAPWVYISYKPSELVLLQGNAKFAPISGTSLSEVTNTKSLLFFHNADKHYYYLTAGRWFRNQQLRGNWEFASDKLPADFQKIPPNHPKAHVLASIPGTDEAADAVLLASVPQMAVINRKEAAREAKVTYIGNPEFKPIEGTTLQYAANTPADVIKYQDRFYLLQEGVWFVGASANGPWEVADTVPQEIYKIPPESPKHNTTYVYVTDSNSDTVTTAQTAGYTGLAIGVGIGVAVWGTGYYYPPYYYWGPMYPYPVYWGYPYYSYGAAAWYNPATGFYGRGAVAYGPYGGYGRSAAYNPATGTYARRVAAYWPYQAGMATSFYNPRTGAWGGGYRYANPYQGWGQGVVAKGDQWARGGFYYDDRGAVGGIRTSEGGRMIAAGDGDNRGMIAKTSDGDLYVGRNGEIYRRDQSGNWQQRGEGGWNNFTPSQEQQQRANQARENATQSRQQGGTASATSREGSARASQQASRTAQTGQFSREGMSSRQAGGGLSEAQREQVRSLDREASARSRGNQNYSSWSSRSPSRSSGSYSGSRMGGGGRSFGGRRR